MSKVERQLGQMLVDRRLLTKDALETHLAQAETSNTPLAQVLVAEGTVREADILAAVAERIDVPYAPLQVAKGSDMIDAQAVGAVDRELAEQLDALPLRIENGSLLVAVADPFNQDKKALLEKASGMPVVLALAPGSAIIERIGEIYETYESLPDDAKETKGSVDAKAVLAEAEALKDNEERPHINDLLEVLLERGGSDLHLTAGSPPQVRVNGSLKALDQFPMMKPAMLRSMIYEILTARQQEQLEETRELDCSH
ncbi:MAG: hypothetical protein HKN93_07920, partial [Acidimicrobiia bacterium]|nr:hypothetical protein [Acidimicrobiia bacterium]